MAIQNHPLATGQALLVHSIDRVSRPGRPDNFVAVFEYADRQVEFDGETYTTVMHDRVLVKDEPR